MCKSKSAGGQRCAGHARTALTKALTSGNPTRMENATIQYASTPQGETVLRQRAEHLWNRGDHHRAATLTNAVNRGATLRHTNSEVARLVAIEHTHLTPTKSAAIERALTTYDTGDTTTAQYVQEVRKALTACENKTATISQANLITRARQDHTPEPAPEHTSPLAALIFGAHT